MKKPFIVRRAVRADAQAVIGLILALAEFEHLTPPDADAQHRLLEDGFGPHPRFETWLAFNPDSSEPLGYALLFETYSSFLARPTLYLEDLFVVLAWRGRGVGKALFERCIRLAAERNCGRMEWSCLDWNTKAQQFYDRLGARRLADWYPYRLQQDQFASALAKADGGNCA